MIKHRSRPPINLLGASSIVPRGPQPATLGLKEASGAISHASVFETLELHENIESVFAPFPLHSLHLGQTGAGSRELRTKWTVSWRVLPQKRESGTSHPVRLVVGCSLAQKQLHDPATVLVCRFHQRCPGEEPFVRVAALPRQTASLHHCPEASFVLDGCILRSAASLRMDSSASADHPKERDTTPRDFSCRQVRRRTD